MHARLAVYVSDSGERAWTTKIFKTLRPAVRIVVARHFIGFHCLVEVDRPVGPAEMRQIAVEGIASSIDGRDFLICTSQSDTHNLAKMEAISLATIRSIKTLRRF